jgi:hypothetical protein
MTVTTEELILEQVLDLKHRLFGNGQPGEIALIKARLTLVEEFKLKTMTVCGVLGGVLVIIFEALLRRYLGGSHG